MKKKTAALEGHKFARKTASISKNIREIISIKT